MGQTKVTISVFLPTTSTSRIADYVSSVFAVAQQNVADGFYSEMSGPFPDEHRETGRVYHGSSKRSGGSAELGRTGTEGTDDRSGSGSDSSAGTDEPKRRRGRPRKEAGTAAEGPERGSDDQDGSARQGTERNVAGGADQDGAEGAGERQEGRRGSERGGSGARGSGSSHSVKDDAGFDDWDDPAPVADDLEGEDEIFHAKTPGDAWPDSLTPEVIDRPVLSALLGDHFKATGGKDRDLTFDLVESVTGERGLKDVPEKSYDKLARAILKDIARYKHGIKKPSK